MNTSPTPTAHPKTDLPVEPINQKPMDPNTPPNALHQLEHCVRHHPGETLLVAVGLGFVAVLAARALTPPPPRSRAVQLLEDIQHRLADLARPAYNRVSGMAEDGVEAFGKGVDGLHLDRKFDRFSRGFKSLFS
jgi:hypothetical protein